MDETQVPVADAPPARSPSESTGNPQPNHRRTASEDLGYTASVASPAGGAFAHDPGMHYYQFAPNQGPGPGAYNPNMSPTPNVPQAMTPPYGHNRVRTWSGNQPFPGAPPVPPYYSSGPGQMPIPSQLSYSPAGNPLVPVLADPSQNGGAAAQMLSPQGSQYANARRKRKGGGHRRVHSYSDARSYGSFGNEIPPAPQGPPPPLPSGRTRDFSPRNEFMKLTGGMRPPSGSTSPRTGIAVSPRQSSVRGMGPPPRPDDMRVSFSPVAPRVPMDSDAHAMGMYGMDGAPIMMPNSPHAPPIVSPNGRSDVGGEAVFLAQKKGKHRKSPSNRKMHMRQRSAQLFMEDVKGVEQLPACRNILFVLLFVFHLLGMVYLGNKYGYEALRLHDDRDDDSSLTIIYSNIIYVACLSGIFAVVVSAVVLLLMTAIAKKLVQIALILTITLSFAWGTIGIGLSPKKVVPATGIIALALSVAYAFIVWDRIPFAAANLNASLSGIKANPGSVLVAFFFQFLALGWSIYFTFVVIGVYDAMELGDIELKFRGMKVVVYVLLGVSYYWTLQVCLNIVQVTVAGLIGSWWFTPDGDTSSRNADMNHSFFRSCFYAIGSICYGSLLVGPVRILRQLSAFFRPNDEVSSLSFLHECLFCIQTCLASGVDFLASRFNAWAFTYIGLYGYGLVDAGLHSTELFEKRGWSTIVSDDLVPNVLLLTNLVIGGITGCVAHLIENIENLSLTSLNQPVATSFLVGSLVGFVVSSVLFGIISSSVNAVIVCFASSPVDFEQNHPQLSQEMRSAWREVWPGCMDVVDMRVAVAAYLDPSLNGNGETEPLLV